MQALMTVPGAADHLGVSVRTLRRLIERGDLPSVRVGRSRRVDPEDLEAYIARQKGCYGPVSDDGCRADGNAAAGGRAMDLVRAIREERD